MKKPLNGLQCVKNICRIKVKVLKVKREELGVVLHSFNPNAWEEEVP